jgi:hypothetical protein
MNDTSLLIELSPAVEALLKEEAAERSLEVADFARILIETGLNQAITLSDARSIAALFEGLPQRTPADLEALARAQGVCPLQRVEELAGTFWPEEESCDQFITWLREGRQEENR